MRSALHATTPFPNALLDEVMPRLKDTEWRLLCVIVRQTLGWRDRGTTNRKMSDWLTQSQLVLKTGRDRAAISRAIDVLVRGDYIEARSEKDQVLSTPSQRRQSKGRIFYGLHPRLLRDSSLNDSPRISEYRESKSNSLLKREIVKSEFHRAPKANTTKETLTKENVTKGTFKNSWKNRATKVSGEDGLESSLDSISETLPVTTHEYSDEDQNFIVLFHKLHEQLKGQKANIALTLEESARLEKLLVSHSPCDWTLILRKFFTSDIGYIMRRGYSLASFLNSCHIFLVKRKSAIIHKN